VVEAAAAPRFRACWKATTPPGVPLRLEAVAVRDRRGAAGLRTAVPPGARKTLNLSPAGHWTQAAANLFAHLRRLDASGARRIAVMTVPDEGLGRAINDRLRRAAAPGPLSS